MSGEFRWVGGTGYMHSVLDFHVDEVGQHELSKLLYDVYKAAQPLERACAYVEASDSGPAEMTVAAVRHGEQMIAACKALEKYIRDAKELADRLLRAHPTAEKS